MVTTGNIPGVGYYKCTNCGQVYHLDDATDTMPPCGTCKTSVSFYKISGDYDDTGYGPRHKKGATEEYTLPGDFQIPDNLKNKITYDGKYITCNNDMTDEEKKLLQQLNTDKSYQDTINRLYNNSNAGYWVSKTTYFAGLKKDGEKELQTSAYNNDYLKKFGDSDAENNVEMKNLPEDFVIPEKLKNKVTYDAEKGLISCKGYLLNAEISAMNTAIKAGIEDKQTQKKALSDFNQLMQKSCTIDGLAIEGAALPDKSSATPGSTITTSIGWNSYVEVDEISLVKIINPKDKSENLPKLPENLEIPSDLRKFVVYKNGKLVLQKGLETEAKNELINLDKTNNQEYRQAIENLYNKSIQKIRIKDAVKIPVIDRGPGPKDWGNAKAGLDFTPKALDKIIKAAGLDQQGLNYKNGNYEVKFKIIQSLPKTKK